MLFLALIAIIIACLCLWLEMRAYNMDIKATEGRVSSLSVEQLGMPVAPVVAV
jgi:hypothetical protein